MTEENSNSSLSLVEVALGLLTLVVMIVIALSVIAPPIELFPLTLTIGNIIEAMGWR